MMGYSTPLIWIDLASTGASPVMRTRFVLVVITFVTVSLKVVASSLARSVRMLARAEEMKDFGPPAAPGSATEMPLSRMALYLASRTGSTFDGNHGPLQISFMPRQ